MDKQLRNVLRHTVTQCRRLLEEAVSEVLQGQFGIHSSGEVEDAARMGHLSDQDRRARAQILAHLAHMQAAGFTPPDAVAQLVREVAFTHLNRLCAYKMMETRGLIREAVSRGLKSQGFMFYLADHPEDEQRWSGGQQDIAYRHFLDWLGGTFSGEIGPLFSPYDPANRLFPPQRILEQVLALINSAELQGIWAEDETLGWIYQYFTPKELRDQARKESQAPRNAYELAFRNQFYTPRYVVQFLTDNTLGRLWYEMRQGKTQLKERCRYLACWPHEVFLAAGEPAPKSDDDAKDLPPEERLRRPVHIPHRPKKDPRDIKILDPACGSGHFLLYAFDLLEVIYEEAWTDPELGPALWRDLGWTPPAIAAAHAEEALAILRRALPGLILRHNLYGIDIDGRATQIAALALWLRAQRAYQALGIKSTERPPITRSNIVCAEPMPGEEELLEEFVATLQPSVLGQLVRAVFRRMKLAGEAGSLLKIEQEISDAITAAKQQWLTWPKAEQLALWPERTRPSPEQLTLFDVSGITDEQFWDGAEARVLEALHDYARRVANGEELLRRLFADDAVQGFAFIDACRQRFDVVLMNPPFGEASKPSKAYVEKAYPRTKNDVYAAFVERGLQLLQAKGMLGAITSRTGFFLSSFQKWREEILLQEARPTVFADLGYGILDTAMVETAAYCLAKAGAAV